MISMSAENPGFRGIELQIGLRQHHLRLGLDVIEVRKALHHGGCPPFQHF